MKTFLLALLLCFSVGIVAVAQAGHETRELVIAVSAKTEIGTTMKNIKFVVKVSRVGAGGCR